MMYKHDCLVLQAFFRLCPGMFTDMSVCKHMYQLFNELFAHV